MYRICQISSKIFLTARGTAIPTKLWLLALPYLEDEALGWAQKIKEKQERFLAFIYAQNYIAQYLVHTFLTIYMLETFLE